MKRITLLIILLFLFLISHGQTTYNGQIKGRVYNASTNEPVEFATVVIFNTTIGAVTDLDGNFLFTGLKPGYVKLMVSSVGFETQVTGEIFVTNANIANIEIPLQESNISINEVVVKASPFRKTEESPVSLRRIGISEIERNPGGNRDISRVIQSLPGVSSSPGFRNDVIVRGGGSSENKFYLDNIEIPNLNHFATQGSSGGPLGIINADFLREADLYSGAFPANKGNALSSVLDMKLLDGNKEKLKFRGSVGASDLALTANGPLNENTTFLISYRRSYLQFLFAALQLPFLPTYNDLQFKVRSRLNDKNEITILGLGALDYFNLNTDANETASQRYILSYLPVNEQQSYTVGAVYKHFSEKGYHTFVVSNNYLNNIAYKYPDNNESIPKSFDYSSSETEYKFRYENTLRFNNKLKLNSGVSLEKGLYKNDTYRELYVYNQPTVIDYNAELGLFSYGFYVQTSYKFFNNRLISSLGTRFDGNNYSESMRNPLNQFSPRMSLSYLLTDKLNLNFNTGIYYQRPPYTSLGFKNQQDEYINKKNQLTYLRADHLVAGVEYQPGQNSFFSIEGFYKKYRDYPFSVNDSVPISSKGADFGTFGDEEILSISEGHAYGLEVLARTVDFKGFNIVLAYTLVRSEFKKHKPDLSLSNNYIPTAWDNHHILNITVLREFKNNWDLGLKWRYVGGSPYTPFDVEKSRIIEAWDAQGFPYLNYNQYNQKRLRPFHQLDFRVDKSFFFKKWSLITYIDIQNVYNFKAEEPVQYAKKSTIYGTPASDDLIFDEKLNKYVYDLQEIESDAGGTVLPSIGIIIEF